MNNLINKILNNFYQIIKILLFVLLFDKIVIQQNSFAQTLGEDPIMINNRVGMEIDRNERDYFYLFPFFTNFEKARFYTQSEYSFKIVIQNSNISGIPDSTLYLSIPEFKKFSWYLTNFEQILEKREESKLLDLNPKLINLFTFRTTGYPLIKKYKNNDYYKIIITDSENSNYNGIVLFANDSSVTIWNDTSFYDWSKTNDHMQIFQYSEIQKIIIERDGSFLGGATTGILVGSGIGVLGGLLSSAGSESKIFKPEAFIIVGGLFFGGTGGLIGGILGAAAGTDDEIEINAKKESFKKISSMLKQNALFNTFAPPEITNCSKNIVDNQIQIDTSGSLKNQQITKKHVQPKIEVIKPEAEKKVNKIHISFLSNYTNTIANNDIADALTKSGFSGSCENWLFGGTVNYPIDESYLLSWHIELSYSYYTNYRIGIGIKKIAPQEAHGIRGVSEKLEGYTGNLFVDWVIDPFDLNTLDRWEHMLGIGITYNKIDISRSIGYFENIISEGKNVYGLQLRSGLDYYPSPSLSFQVKFSIDIVPSFSLGEYKSYEEDEILKKHSINLSGFDISVGFRIHI